MELFEAQLRESFKFEVVPDCLVFLTKKTTKIQNSLDTLNRKEELFFDTQCGFFASQNIWIIERFSTLHDEWIVKWGKTREDGSLEILKFTTNGELEAILLGDYINQVLTACGRQRRMPPPDAVLFESGVAPPAYLWSYAYSYYFCRDSIEYRYMEAVEDDKHYSYATTNQGGSSVYQSKFIDNASLAAAIFTPDWVKTLNYPKIDQIIVYSSPGPAPIYLDNDGSDDAQESSDDSSFM